MKSFGAVVTDFSLWTELLYSEFDIKYGFKTGPINIPVDQNRNTFTIFFAIKHNTGTSNFLLMRVYHKYTNDNDGGPLLAYDLKIGDSNFEIVRSDKTETIPAAYQNEQIFFLDCK